MMDINKLAKSIVDKATKEDKKEKPEKNLAAVALGRLGGVPVVVSLCMKIKQSRWKQGERNLRFKPLGRSDPVCPLDV